MKKRKNQKGKAFSPLKAIILVMIIVAVGIGIYFANLDSPCDKNSTELYSVEIPTGSGTAAIGQILENQGIIKSSAKFKLVSKLEAYDGKYKAGVYSLSPSMPMSEIMEIIISGVSNTSRFTIPEGLTLSQTADRLEKENLINRDAFMSEIQHGSFEYRFMNLLPDSENRLEGFLYPETYDVYSNADEHDIIEKMLSQFDRLVTDEHYQRAEAMGYDMYDIVTIASLIERETLVSSEKGKVASVIYNRLAVGMPLQIDASVQYALPEHKERLSYDDLKVDSPYNTYQKKGLPPGPICSPGIDSIEAALYPENTNYYYYVLSPDNDGSHRFSNTYEEFLRNKKEYTNSL